MINLKPKMFDEASKSHASPNLAVQLISFVVLFLVIYLAESIVPAILSYQPLMDILTEQGKLDEGQKLSISEAIEYSAKLTESPRIMVSMLISTVAGTLLSIFYCRFIEMRTVSSMGVRKRRLVPNYFIGIGVGLLMMTTITMLTVLSGANSIKLCSDINVKIILLFLLGFFFQGMSEEFIFRGCLMNSVGGKHSPYLAIAISSVAFAAAHLANPGISVLAMINLTLFGVFAAVYMIYFDDIWGVCAIHSIWNFSQGNIFGISVSGSVNAESVFRTVNRSDSAVLNGGNFGIEGSIFTTLVLCAGTAVMLLLIKKKQSPKTK